MPPFITLALLPDMDFNRPAEDVLIDLIYISTKFRVSKHHIKFGLPMELDQRPDIDDDENTFIPIAIDPAYDSRFAGSNGVMYRRLPFDSLIVKVDMKIRIDHFPFYPEELLSQFNIKYGLQLTVADIDNTEVTSIEGFKMKISPTSLIWIGGIDPELSYGGLDLAGLILKTKLAGFDKTGGFPIADYITNKVLAGFEFYVHPPLVTDPLLKGFKEYSETP